MNTKLQLTKQKNNSNSEKKKIVHNYGGRVALRFDNNIFINENNERKPNQVSHNFNLQKHGTTIHMETNSEKKTKAMR
jgi:hypothetical protein